MDSIRIILIEDNRIMREGILTMIRSERDFEIMACESNREAIQKINDYKPHVILMDFTLQDEFSLHMVELINEKIPEAKIIIMDLTPLQAEVVKFVKAGVSGFILKDATFDDFLETVRSVADGEKVLPAPLIGKLFAQIVTVGIKKQEASPEEDLPVTSREKQVVGYIGKGYSNKEIANELNLSVDTVKSHVHNILEKLSLENRTQIANYIHSYKNLQAQ